jgi:hypothetical protein
MTLGRQTGSRRKQATVPIRRLSRRKGRWPHHYSIAYQAGEKMATKTAGGKNCGRGWQSQHLLCGEGWVRGHFHVGGMCPKLAELAASLWRGPARPRHPADGCRQISQTDAGI